MSGLSESWRCAQRADIRQYSAVFRSSVWARGYLIVLGIVGTLLGLAMVIAAPDVGGQRVGIVIALPCLWFTVRAARAGLYVRSDHLRIRGLFRTKTVARGVITETGWSDSSTLLPWRRLTLRRTDGEVIEVPEVSVLVIGDRGEARCAETLSSLDAALGDPKAEPTE